MIKLIINNWRKILGCFLLIFTIPLFIGIFCSMFGKESFVEGFFIGFLSEAILAFFIGIGWFIVELLSY
jgi:hypothetical protein